MKQLVQCRPQPFSLPLRRRLRAIAFGLIAPVLWLGCVLSCPVRTSAVDTIVVRPKAWAPALLQWKQYRTAQGHTIAELDASLTRDELLQEIRRIGTAPNSQLRFIVLAGDVGRDADTTIPTFYHDSTAMVQFGGDPTIASDNSYADLDWDGTPDVAIGRIPADTEHELLSQLQRVVRYETQTDYAPWRRDVHVVAGVGGFGALADSIIEMTTRRFLADRIPGWSKVSMTQASLDSSYCPDPYRFSEACIERMNSGGMFWVYIGHGHVKNLDYLKHNNQLLPILTNEHIPVVSAAERPPIAVFLACYTGAFDALEDSLAERLVISENGPIAALAASRVSGPYGLAMLSNGLLNGCFEGHTPTLGEIILESKQELLRIDPSTIDQLADQQQVSQLQMIGAIAKAMSPAGYDLRAEHAEHVWEMNLLGDPLLRISRPRQIDLEVPARSAPGEDLVVSGRLTDNAEDAANIAIQGSLTVELAHRRGRLPRELQSLKNDPDSKQGRDDMQSRYLAANTDIITSLCVQVQAGEFSVELAVPPDLPSGRYCVRAFVEGQNEWFVGYTELNIRQRR